MDWSVLCNIVESLRSASYQGWFAFHNYNEPLYNERLFDEISMVRERLPLAKPCIYTNGDRLDEDTYGKLCSLGVKNIRVTLYTPALKSRNPPFSSIWQWLTQRGLERVGDWQESLARQGPALEILDECHTQVILPDVSKYYDRGGIIAYLSTQPRVKPCYLTSNSLAVDYKGNIKMCCNVVEAREEHKAFILGNAAVDEIMSVWQSDSFEKLRKLHLRSDWTSSPICKKCRQEVEP